MSSGTSFRGLILPFCSGAKGKKKTQGESGRVLTVKGAKEIGRN